MRKNSFRMVGWHLKTQRIYTDAHLHILHARIMHTNQISFEFIVVIGSDCSTCTFYISNKYILVLDKEEGKRWMAIKRTGPNCRFAKRSVRYFRVKIVLKKYSKIIFLFPAKNFNFQSYMPAYAIVFHL